MVSKVVNEMIPTIQACLKQQPVERAWLFGSFSRGEEREDSDVDILVQYIDSDSMSLMKICRIMCAIEDAIGRKVDLVEDGRLIDSAIDSVNHDKNLIYERAA